MAIIIILYLFTVNHKDALLVQVLTWVTGAGVAI